MGYVPDMSLPRLSGLLLAALSTAAPALAAPRVRTAPEPSDIALAGFALVAVWLVRRALRARFARDRPPRD